MFCELVVEFEWKVGYFFFLIWVVVIGCIVMLLLFEMMEVIGSVFC